MPQTRWIYKPYSTDSSGNEEKEAFNQTFIENDDVMDMERTVSRNGGNMDDFLVAKRKAPKVTKTSQNSLTSSNHTPEVIDTSALQSFVTRAPVVNNTFVDVEFDARK